jgi:hypothetical protein
LYLSDVRAGTISSEFNNKERDMDKLQSQTSKRAGPGKMKRRRISGRWWVNRMKSASCTTPSRAAKHIENALGLTRPNGAVLQSDGYSAYAHYATKTGITHAQCWAHSRRKIYEARDIEPAHADQALELIAALYKVEQQIRSDGLTGQAKRVCRQEQSKPVLAVAAADFTPLQIGRTSIAYSKRSSRHQPKR